MGFNAQKMLFILYNHRKKCYYFFVMKVTETQIYLIQEVIMKKVFNHRNLLLAAAAGVCVSAFAGAALAAGNDDRVLRLSILAPLTTIDQHRTVNLQDDIFLRQIYESLYFQNEKTGEYEPRVAESYTVSEDGLIYKFKIRKNAKFHNGDPVKVSDCVFSFKRASTTPQKKSCLAGVKDIRAEGDDTIVFELKHPNSAFLNSLCLVAVLSEREVTEQGEQFGTKVALAGTGPYYLTSLKHDVEWTCNAFPEYYRGVAKIKKLDYKPITQAAAGLIAFEAGELDWYIAPIANWDDLKANEKYNTQLVPANHISFLVINPNVKPLDDENLRKAIAYCIDKDAMNMTCYDGLAVNADFMVQKQNTGAPTEGIVYNYDPDKAKEYLAKSAYPNGVDIGVINCSAGGYFEKMAQVLQQNLADIGITAKVNRLDSATNMNNMRKQNFSIAPTGFSPSGDFDFYRKFSQTDFVGSFYVKFDETPYDWKHMNELWEKGVSVKTVEERKAVYRELNDWIANTATYLPIFHKVQPYVWVKDLVIPVNYPTNPQVYEWSWKD